jgi:hypothetical protein
MDFVSKKLLLSFCNLIELSQRPHRMRNTKRSHRKNSTRPKNEKKIFETFTGGFCFFNKLYERRGLTDKQTFLSEALLVSVQ